MKKIYSFLVLFFLLTGNVLFAQLLLPQFSPVEKQEISSDKEDSSPITYNDGNGIYYNRTYTEKDGETVVVTGQEIWFVEKGKKGWGKPLRLLREEDLPGENLIVGANKAGTRIYVFNALPEGDSLYRRLYYLDKTDKKYEWTAPTEVIIPELKYGDDYINFYVNSEETAIIVSKPPKGRSSDVDLFVSLKDEKGNWRPIINLGETINSKRLELGTFITNNLKTIYFSSEGHGGYGASDVFVSMRLDDSWQNWTKPLNLGEPINSIGFDAFFMMANANEVYFTSDRGDEYSNIFKGTITGEVVLANTDSLKAIFIHKGKPAVGVKFNISDSKNNEVAKVTTDEKGTFKFEKLKGEENFLVKMEEEDSDFVGSKIYFVNEKDEKTNRYVYTKDGLFVNSKDLGSSGTVQGVFNYNELPAIRTGLVVMDENGFPLDTIYTDEKGNFTYTVLNGDDGFSLIPLNMTDDEFINADIYLVKADGKRLQTITPRKFHTLTIDDVELVESTEQNLPEFVKGVFIYNGLPAAGSGLIILDEDGFPLDTIFTDENGKFNYTALNLEDEFSVVPLDLMKDELVNADVYLVDDKGERIDRVIMGDAKLVAMLKDKVTQPEKPMGIDLENLEGAEQEITAWEQGSEGSKTIYFDFEESKLNKVQENKLSMVVSLARLGPNRKIILTGHTDDSGEERLNYSFGLARAQSVRAYLISKGVAGERIEVLSEGEKKPKADNSSADGRAKNRRVEIRIK